MTRLVLVAALLAACAKHPPPPPATATTRVVRDGLGREVRVPTEVRRIVSLAPSTTEILFALGVGDRVVGVDRYSDFPVEARRLPQLGADIDPNLERLLALKPDVVLTATSANTQSTAETLERLGVPVVVSRADRLDDIYADIARIGDLVGVPDAARHLVGQMRARIDAVRARYAKQRPVRTLVVVWTDPLIVAGRASHVADLVRAAGGENAADDADMPFPTYSVERVLARAPEVVILGTHKEGGAPPTGPLERLATLPAVRDHRIYAVDGDLLFRPGPRVADGVETLARLLHDAP